MVPRPPRLRETAAERVAERGGCITPIIYWHSRLRVRGDWATLLAAARRLGGVAGQTRLLNISQSLQEKLTGSADSSSLVRIRLARKNNQRRPRPTLRGFRSPPAFCRQLGPAAPRSDGQHLPGVVPSLRRLPSCALQRNRLDGAGHCNGLLGLVFILKPNAARRAITDGQNAAIKRCIRCRCPARMSQDVWLNFFVRQVPIPIAEIPTVLLSKQFDESVGKKLCIGNGHQLGIVCHVLM